MTNDRFEWEVGSGAAGAFESPPGSPARPPALPTPGALLGGHTLGRVLGSGAMGTVYEAVGARGRVALKVLKADLTSAAQRERFLREAQTAAALDHPGIVRVHSAGEDRGLLWIAFELIEPARGFAHTLETLEPAARVELIARVADAVGHAHSRGVVHRDLKPENVLVDATGQPRVTDFGLALRGDLDRLTRSGAWVGTPLYMSPEQLTGDRAHQGPPADVWALGVMLHEALTGEHPFPASSAQDLMAQVLSALPAEPPGVEPRLAAVVRRALQRDPERRYPDARSFAAALRAPPEPSFRAWRAVGLMGGALVGLLMAGAALLARSDAQADAPPAPERDPSPQLEALIRADLAQVASAAQELGRALEGRPPDPRARRALLASQARVMSELTHPTQDWGEPAGAALERQASQALAALQQAAAGDPASALALERERAPLREPAAWLDRLLEGARSGELPAVRVGRRCRAALGEDLQALAALDRALGSTIARLLAEPNGPAGAPFLAMILETVRVDLLGGAFTGRLEWPLVLPGTLSGAELALHGLWLLRTAQGDALSTLPRLTPAWYRAARPSRLLLTAKLLQCDPDQLRARAGLELAIQATQGGPAVVDDLPAGGSRADAERRIRSRQAIVVLRQLGSALRTRTPPSLDWCRDAAALATALLELPDLDGDLRSDLLWPAIRLLEEAARRGIPPARAEAALRGVLARAGSDPAPARGELLLLIGHLLLDQPARADELEAIPTQAMALGLPPASPLALRLDLLRVRARVQRGDLEASERLLQELEERAGGAPDLWLRTGDAFVGARLAVARARGLEAEGVDRLRTLLPALRAQAAPAQVDELARDLPGEGRPTGDR